MSVSAPSLSAVDAGGMRSRTYDREGWIVWDADVDPFADSIHTYLPQLITVGWLFAFWLAAERWLLADRE